MRTVHMFTKVGMAVAFLLSAGVSFAKEVPASPTTYVYNEGVLKNPEIVSKQLADFEKRTGHQMVVAFFKSLDGDNLEGYANKVFKTWKIGDKKRNDGLLFAAFLGDRKWRVEVGYGFEGKLTDMQAYNIATAAAVPSFKKGDFDGGVQAVVAALQNTLTSEPRGSLQTSAAPIAGAVATGSVVAAAEAGIPGWLIILGIIALVLFVIWLIYMTGGDILTGLGSGGGYSSGGSSGGSSSGGSSSGSSFSGGGGSSGGGGASGGW